MLFLASYESRYITGASMIIDGGNTLQEEYLGLYHVKKDSISETYCPLTL